jgi:hypothetical protein
MFGLKCLDKCLADITFHTVDKNKALGTHNSERESTLLWNGECIVGVELEVIFI